MLPTLDSPSSSPSLNRILRQDSDLAIDLRSLFVQNESPALEPPLRSPSVEAAKNWFEGGSMAEALGPQMMLTDRTAVEWQQPEWTEGKQDSAETSDAVVPSPSATAVPSPSTNNFRFWSDEENALLWDLRMNRTLSWSEISSRLGGRTVGAVQQHYHWLRRNRGERQGPNQHAGGRLWSPNEDALLQNLVESELTWKEIAERLPGRTLGSATSRWSLLKSFAAQTSRFPQQDFAMCPLDPSTSSPPSTAAQHSNTIFTSGSDFPQGGAITDEEKVEGLTKAMLEDLSSVRLTLQVLMKRRFGGL